MHGFLVGTGAAEGVPSAWCCCERCEALRRRGGRSLRSNASLFLEPGVLIDLPPSAPEQLRRAGKALAQVRHLVITHAHADHLYPDLLRRRRSPGTGMDPRRIADPCLSPPADLEVVASPAVVDRLLEHLGSGCEEALAIRFRPVLPGETVEVGLYRVTPVLANHEVKGDTPYNYVIEGPRNRESVGAPTAAGAWRSGTPAAIGEAGAVQAAGGACWFYGCDTGPLFEATWEVLRRFRLDGLILEATGGDGESEAFPHHLTLAGVAATVERFRREGLLRDRGRVILSHLDAHHWPPHEEAERLVEPYGWEIGHDGMRLEGLGPPRT